MTSDIKFPHACDEEKVPMSKFLYLSEIWNGMHPSVRSEAHPLELYYIDVSLIQLIPISYI